MSKLKELNKLVVVKEDSEKDYSEVFADGNEVTAKDIDDSEEESSYIFDNQIGFCAKPEDITEVHLFSGSEFTELAEYFNSNGTLGNFPVVEKDGENLRLSSSYGTQQENYIICKKATCNSY